MVGIYLALNTYVYFTIPNMRLTCISNTEIFENCIFDSEWPLEFLCCKCKENIFCSKQTGIYVWIKAFCYNYTNDIKKYLDEGIECE